MRSPSCWATTSQHSSEPCAERTDPHPAAIAAGALVIVAVIPPWTTPKTGGVQTDGEANLTSEDDTRRHPMDGREATHNWLAPDSTRWTRGCSSVGQSRRLITARSQVRGLPAPQASVLA